MCFVRCNVKKSHFPVNILGNLLHPADTVRNLDCDAMKTLFLRTCLKDCKAYFSQMCDLRQISILLIKWRSFPADALVSSCLNYCNSLFRGLCSFKLHELQSNQNAVVCVMTNHRKCAHVTPILK